MKIATLYSKSGAPLSLGYDFKSSFQELVDNQQADCFILATEYGYSPLGLAGEVIAAELEVPDQMIAEAADWNRSENQEVSLIGIRKRSGSRPGHLKGSVLAASQTSISYNKFVRDAMYSKPSRDFFYNVTYEAINYAVHNLKARKLTISHLSASGNYHEDIATCTAEALAHFHDEFPGMIDSFMFVGCCIGTEHLKGIVKLTSERMTTRHIPIKITNKEIGSFDLITLDIKPVYANV